MWFLFMIFLSFKRCCHDFKVSATSQDNISSPSNMNKGNVFFPHIIPINYILEWHDISSSRGSGRLLAQIAGHNNLQLIYKEKYFLQGIYIYWLGGLRNSIKNISAGNNKLLEWNNHFTKLKIRKTQNLYKSQFKNKNGTCYTQRELNV